MAGMTQKRGLKALFSQGKHFKDEILILRSFIKMFFLRLRLRLTCFFFLILRNKTLLFYV